MRDCFDTGDSNLRNRVGLENYPLADDPTFNFSLVRIDIKQGHGDPCTYEGLKPPITCYKVAKDVSDGTGALWDTYLIVCPHGPPCDKFLELFGFTEQQPTNL